MRGATTAPRLVMVATWSPAGENTAPGDRSPFPARARTRRVAARHGRPPPRPSGRDVRPAQPARRPGAFPHRPAARVLRPARRPDPRGARQAPEVLQEGAGLRGG